MTKVRKKKADIRKAERDKKARQRQDLIDGGGKIATVRFTAPAVQALERAKEAGYNMNEAVNEALLGEWPPPK